MRDCVGSDGNYRLTDVERPKFSDIGLAAMDLDGNAGTLARLLGAVFGREAVGNRVYAGIGLSIADRGMSPVDPALELRRNGTINSVVELLWTNVVGSPPTTEQGQPVRESADRRDDECRVADLVCRDHVVERGKHHLDGAMRSITRAQPPAARALAPRCA